MFLYYRWNIEQAHRKAVVYFRNWYQIIYYKEKYYYSYTLERDKIVKLSFMSIPSYIYDINMFVIYNRAICEHL